MKDYTFQCFQCHTQKILCTINSVFLLLKLLTNKNGASFNYVLLSTTKKSVFPYSMVTCKYHSDFTAVENTNISFRITFTDGTLVSRAFPVANSRSLFSVIKLSFLLVDFFVTLVMCTVCHFF